MAEAAAQRGAAPPSTLPSLPIRVVPRNCHRLLHTASTLPSTNSRAAERPTSARLLRSPAVPLASMQLTVVTATGRRERLELPQAQLTEAALRAAVVRQLSLAPTAAAQLRLVHGGQPLADDEAVSILKDGGEAGAAGWPTADRTRAAAAAARLTAANERHGR